MNTVSRPMSDAHIHAYVDGQLKREGEHRLQTLLGARPEKHEQIQEYQAINVRLRQELAFILAEELSPGLSAILGQAKVGQAKVGQAKVGQAKVGQATLPRQAAAKPRAKPRVKPQIAPSPTPAEPASAVTVNVPQPSPQPVVPDSPIPPPPEPTPNIAAIDLDTLMTAPAHSNPVQDGFRGLWFGMLCIVGLVALGGGWSLRQHTEFAAERLATQINSALTAHLLYANESDHVVDFAPLQVGKYRQWLNRWLGQRLVIPNLSAMQLEFLGARLLPITSAEAAGFLVYRKEKHPATISVYVNRIPKAITVSLPTCEQPPVAGAKPLTVCYWFRHSLNYLVVSDLPVDDTRAAAKEVLRQIVPEK